jgi:hypothetical protein
MSIIGTFPAPGDGQLMAFGMEGLTQAVGGSTRSSPRR